MAAAPPATGAAIPDTHHLTRFLAPSSIAVVGASPDTSKIRGMLVPILRNNGYGGRLYPVNPNHATIGGVVCYPSLAAIGTKVDLALIAIPAHQVLAALEACVAAGVDYAVVISSGFAEQGRAQELLQRRISELAKSSGMRICGPNGEGFHNELAKVSATFSPAVDRAAQVGPTVLTGERIAIIAQSGGIGFALYQRGRAQGLSFSYVVTTGNEADLTATDFLNYAVDDPQTAAVLLFLETVRDPQGFVAVAGRAAKKRKPIVVVKAGRSPAGERATLSHTASLAGWSAAYNAVFETHGIIKAFDPDEAIAILALLVTCPLPRGTRTGIITTSGGAGVWVADSLTAAGLPIPELTEDLQTTIRGLIPAYGSARNPVDITAQGVHTPGFGKTLELLSNCEEIDMIVVVSSMARESRVLLDTTTLERVKQGKPMVFYSYTLPSDLARRTMAESGSVVFTALGALGRAIREVVRFAGFVPQISPPVSPALQTMKQRLGAVGGTLSEYQSKILLGEIGVRVLPALLVRSREDLVGASRRLRFPLAAKVQSRDILHKTEAGGVRLNISDEAALAEAYDAIMAAVTSCKPDAEIEGVLLEPMALPGIEMIIGVIRDALFGPVCMVGAGGIAAELFQDVSFRLAPVSEAEAVAMIAQLRSLPLLEGYRGGPRADVTSLAGLLAHVSAFAVACRDRLQEIELNPVIVRPEGSGYTVADALIVLDRQTGI